MIFRKNEFRVKMTVHAKTEKIKIREFRKNLYLVFRFKNPVAKNVIFGFKNDHFYDADVMLIQIGQNYRGYIRKTVSVSYFRNS